MKRTSAAETVRRELVALIEAGELAVGEQLPTESELARAFGVSRPVVREALGGLRGAGVIHSRAGRGSFVAARRPTGLLLGRYSVEELHEVRTNLEIPGAAQAAMRRLPEHVERLGALLDEQARTKDVREWVALDAAFHVCLAEATGNGVQLRLVEDFRDLLVEQSLEVASVAGRVEEANREHRAIFSAVAAGDAAAARRAMRRHLDNVARMARSTR